MFFNEAPEFDSMIHALKQWEMQFNGK